MTTPCRPWRGREFSLNLTDPGKTESNIGKKVLLSNFRRLVQILSTVLSNSYIGAFFTKTVNTNVLKGGCVPVLNCYACPAALFSCPIGALQHFVAIRMFPYYVLGFIGIIGLTVGRMTCGWLCPFGLLQDLMYKIRSPKFKIPFMLRYVKYLVLILLVGVLPYIAGQPWFCRICPAGTLTAGIPWALWNPANPATGAPVLPNGPGIMFYLALMVLAGFLIWFVVSKRPFCRVACPLGAIWALFNRFSMIRLETDAQCDGCNNCRSVCPMDLDVQLDSPECIRRLECTRCEHVKLITPFTNTGEDRCAQRQETL